MTRIVVLFNLKPGTDVSAYEAWARSTDLPTVRGLKSVDGFSVHKATGLLGTDTPSPFQYVEIIDVNDMGIFSGEVATQTMQQVAAAFQGFADNPVFILTEDIG